MDKIINLLINNWTKGVDTYTHNGSTWLIFTEQKSWVIELTESKTLWYNYNFFNELFSLASMDVMINQYYITKWVEDNIINRVNEIKSDNFNVSQSLCEEVIKNGVKETFDFMEQTVTECDIDNIIQNGIKETHDDAHNHKDIIDGVIKNGVKATSLKRGTRPFMVKDTIKNGVRHTLNTEYMPTSMVQDIIENGVKETNPVDVMKFFDNKMEDALEKGIKETNHIKNNVRETKHFEEHLAGTIDSVIDNGKLVSETFVGGIEQIGNVNTVLNCGIKETKTPGDGDIVSTVEWMKENNSTSYPKMIEDVIENGVKETKVCNYIHPEMNCLNLKTGNQIDDVIENGEKINGTFVGGKIQKENIEVVIDYGVKEIKPIGKEAPNYPKVVINHIIQNGTKNPSV